MLTSTKYIGIGIAGAGIAAVLVIVIAGHEGKSSGAAPVSTNQIFGTSGQIVHTADWYVAHPDMLKRDDAKCGGDAASISQAACQNAATADQRLLAAQLGQAAVSNAGTQNTPAQRLQ